MAVSFDDYVLKIVPWLFRTAESTKIVEHVAEPGKFNFRKQVEHNEFEDIGI